MKTLTRTLIASMMIAVLAACSGRASSLPPAQPNPYAVQPGDASMMRGEIRVDSAGIRLAESYPPQVFVDLAYFQPTPCYQLRVERHAPDAQNRIRLDA